ncbi:hypothetical protein P9112_008186 [Eukaryota sp. TZLM1-RC]
MSFRPLSSKLMRPGSSLRSTIHHLEEERSRHISSSLDFSRASEIDEEIDMLKKQHLELLVHEEQQRQLLERKALDQAEQDALQALEEKYSQLFKEHNIRATKLRLDLTRSQRLHSSPNCASRLSRRSSSPMKTKSRLERDLEAAQEQLIKQRRYEEAAQAKRSQQIVEKTLSQQRLLQEKMFNDRIQRTLKVQKESEFQHLEEKINKERLNLEAEYKREKELLIAKYRNNRQSMNHAHCLELLSKPAPLPARYTPKATDRGSRLHKKEKILVNKSVPIPSKLLG